MLHLTMTHASGVRRPVQRLNLIGVFEPVTRLRSLANLAGPSGSRRKSSSGRASSSKHDASEWRSSTELSEWRKARAVPTREECDARDSQAQAALADEAEAQAAARVGRGRAVSAGSAKRRRRACQRLDRPVQNIHNPPIVPPASRPLRVA